MAKPVARRGEGRGRVLQAALDLFAEHGVSGTSLQMIAEKLGVTKAAVYYQFHSKDDIVLAVVHPAFEQMAHFVEAAEAEPDRAAQLDRALTGLVDLVVHHRRLAGVLQRDPAVGVVIGAQEQFRSLVERLNLLLTGPDPDPATRVAFAMLGGGLMLSGADPTLADLADDFLRRELLDTARLLLRLPAGI